MTVRRVLECCLENGPLSRADLTRETGISAPTVSKAVVDLLDSGLLEEGEAPDNALGRPGKRLQLAQDSAQVIGIVLDPHTCEILPASLSGRIDTARRISFATPGQYDALREKLKDSVAELTVDPTTATLGIGISTPGLVNEADQESLFSPNLQAINHQSPAYDLTNDTGFTTVSIQESRALCLAERFYGKARGLDDFAMMDITTGLGLGVFSGGELLSGLNGFAGELGHITVDPAGRLCGCGNHGCLETLATDTALAAMVSDRLGQPIGVTELLRQIRNSDLQVAEELNRVCEYLSIALAAAINLFNPSNLFLHGRFLTISDAVMEQVVRMTQNRTLAPSFENCEIQMAGTTKRQAAIAAIVHHLTRAAGPRVTE